MAKVEMDISEYEVIQESKKLLKEALEEQKRLSDEVIKLKEEKVKALEDAKMKVVKVEKKVTEEHVLLKRSIDSVLKGLKNILESRWYKIKDDDIINTFFEKRKTGEFTEPETTITTHGLDEVKQELRAEIEKELKEEIDKWKNEVRRRDDLVDKNKELELTNKLQNIEIENFKSLEEELLKTKEESQNLINNLRKALKYKANIFNKSRILNEVVEIVKDYEQ